MKKITFGIPEEFVPTKFCGKLSYSETDVKYPVSEIRFKKNARGCVLEFPIKKGENFFGLGLQLKAFNLTGKKYTLRVNADPIAETGDSHAPVPFFVSTHGYGIFIDTLRYAEFDFGRYNVGDKKTCSEKKIVKSIADLYETKPLTDNAVVTVQIPVAKGVDIYIIEGENITDVVSRYNMLSGGGCNPPEWGLGTIYRCFAAYTQEEVLATAQYFRDKDFPVSIIGLEPGWQTRCYSSSFVWNPELFPNPKEMIETLYSEGYHVNLWEHAFTHPDSPMYDKLLPYSGNYEVWEGLVPDFSCQEARDIFASYHKENVTFGLIDGFKIDECDGSDYTNGWTFPLCSEFPSGMDGEQYHSLFGVLYMQTIQQIIGETFSEVRNAGALCASYPFVLYSDLYEHKDFIRGLTTAGFSGLLWTSEVRHADSKEEFLRRLQTTVFSPQCLINAWYCKEVPWIAFDCEKEVRNLLVERQKLLPRIKRAFQLYQEKGVAPVRALVSDYSSDEETYKIDDEYCLGDDLLVAPMVCGEKQRKVYLPKGKWKDYWTGETVENGWLEITTEKIPVFIKIL